MRKLMVPLALIVALALGGGVVVAQELPAERTVETRDSNAEWGWIGLLGLAGLLGLRGREPRTGRVGEARPVTR